MCPQRTVESEERVLGPMTFATNADARAAGNSGGGLTRGVLRQVRPEQMVLFADYFMTWIALVPLERRRQELRVQVQAEGLRGAPEPTLGC